MRHTHDYLHTKQKTHKINIYACNTVVRSQIRYHCGGYFKTHYTKKRHSVLACEAGSYRTPLQKLASLAAERERERSVEKRGVG